MSARFAHLHVHSEYSLADSTIRIKELIAAASQRGIPALAVTDRNNLFALVKFFRAAEAAGIKPIAGADVAIAQPGEPVTWLTLLCRDDSGYKALSRLISRAWMEGHRSEGVALHPAWLGQEDLTGLIAIAGRQSLAGSLAEAGRHDHAQAALRDLQGHFGDRLALAISRTGRAGEERFNPFAIASASTLGIPLVASNDVRFIDSDGFDAHEARVCIASGRVLDDAKRPREYSAQQYLRTADEMATLFADLPDALDNSLRLAERCNLTLNLGTYYLPDFPVPDEHTLESWIRHEAHAGLAARLEKQPLAEGKTREDYLSRLDRELDVIVRMGFPGYFLIVADFINWGKAQGIPVGPGRGSGAGSLVAWALGITDLDPLPYDLLFERFLNPERVSMPDFDIDFCMDRRDEVIDYVARKYGRERVSQIITYGTMAAKAVVRDTGRVQGLPYGLVDGVAKLIPMTLGIGLEDALGRTEKSQKDDAWRSDELIARYGRDEEVRSLIDLALQLEDLTRNAGKHAGGVVIAPKPLAEFCPLFAEHDEGGRGKNPVTQFDKDDVEAIGLVKFDFLGLRTLTIIDWAVKAVNRNKSRDSIKPGLGTRDSGLDKATTGTPTAGEASGSGTGTAKAYWSEVDSAPTLSPESRVPSPESRSLPVQGPDAYLDISTIPLDDKATYDLFARGDTVAVFQFESSGMRRLLKDALPDRFEDLIALVSLYRPGPMDLIPDFIDRKHGRAEVVYPHPLLEPVLSPTYGVVVYQEQVMQTAQILAGYSLGGADLLRRAMGKKKVEEMAAERAKFEAGAAATHGIAPAVSGPIFDLLEKFAGYGFNKSHAAAYALVSYQTAWLKAHYPAEFMAAVLSSDMDKTEKVVGFLDEAAAMQLTVLPPDVNHSAYMFEAVTEGTLRYGLGAIKGVGQGACEAIVAARNEGGAFTDLLDFCQRTASARLNRRTLEALVFAGALDALAPNRASLLLQLPEVMRATEQLARERDAGQVSLFATAPSVPALALELPVCHDWPLAETLKRERETLGFYLSGHPVDPYRPELQELVGTDLGALDTLWAERADDKKGGWRAEKTVILAGQVTAQRRRGESQAFVTLEDGKGRIECAFFAEAFSDNEALLTQGRILVVEGGLREDEFSGGFSLRVRRCWDFDALCKTHALGLAVRLDLRQGAPMPEFEKLLHAHRPGTTAMKLELWLEGACGQLELRGAAHGLAIDQELPAKLRALPGVRAVKLALAKPWAA